MCTLIEKWLDEGNKELPDVDPMKFADVIAELPECQTHGNPAAEYADVREDKIWSPIEENDEQWIPRYVATAQSALTGIQVANNVPAVDAIENVCTDYGLEYVLGVLYKSSGVPMCAIKRLMEEKLPRKLIDRWSIDQVTAFASGLKEHRKNFAAIRKTFLPQKTTTEIVDFYYAWKRSAKAAKGIVASRARRLFKTRADGVNVIIESPHTAGIVTRSRTAERSQCNRPRQTSSISKSRQYVKTLSRRKRKIQSLAPEQ